MFVLLAACTGDRPQAERPETPVPPPVEGPALPPPPRLGVAEVKLPDGVVMPTAIVDQQGPVLVDLWVDTATTDAATLEKRLVGWGLEVVDTDGDVFRVRADGGATLAGRLAAAPGVRAAREALTRVPLPSGAYREGSATYGALTWTWRHAEGPPVLPAALALPASLPTSLPPGALHCLAPALADVELGLVQGPGWVAGRAADPQAWVLVVEDYGFCRATGHVTLTPEAPAAALAYGGRAETDDAWFASLASTWLASPRAELDPMAEAAVAWLAKASDASLARAMRDAAPGPAQIALFRAFEARDPDAALAVAAGSPSAALRAQAVGQDEGLRRGVLDNPAAAPEELLGALVGFSPKVGDPTLDRLLQHRDRRVRARVWELLIAEQAEACAARAKGPLELPAAEQLYRECPAQRGWALERVRSLDAKVADGLLRGTLASPETSATGVAAVKAAAQAGSWDALRTTVASRLVPRDVRRFALETLLANGDAQAPALRQAHGAFLGVAPPPDGITDGAPGAAPAGGTP